MAQSLPEDFRIDIAQEQSYKYIQAKQYDHNSRMRRLIITENNIPKSFTGQEYIELSMWDNGDNYANEPCTFQEDGYPYLVFTDYMLSHAGDILCEVRIYDHKNGTVTTSFNFNLDVSKSLLDQDRLVSSAEFNILNHLILQACTIPDLIEEFNLSQTEIATLVRQLTADIAEYNRQFTEMKTTYTDDFKVLISQITSDLEVYQSEYSSLKSDITTLQSTITAWYTTAAEAENTRIANEQNRQTATSAAIENCKKATEDTNAAITDANQACEEARTASTEATKQALYAQNQGNRVDIALQDFEFRLRTIDGGTLIDTTPSDTVFDGGTL